MREWMGAGVSLGLQNRCVLLRGRVGSIPTHSRHRSVSLSCGGALASPSRRSLNPTARDDVPA